MSALELELASALGVPELEPSGVFEVVPEEPQPAEARSSANVHGAKMAADAFRDPKEKVPMSSLSPLQ